MNFLSAIPYFWLALLSLFVFAYLLNWFPLTGGAYDSLNFTPGWSFDYVGSVIQYAFLPALTLVISSLAGWMLTMRNSMITTLSEDYVLYAGVVNAAPTIASSWDTIGMTFFLRILG